MQSFIPFCVFENKYIPKNIEQKRGGGEGKRNEILYIFPRPDEDIFQQHVPLLNAWNIQLVVLFI